MKTVQRSSFKFNPIATAIALALVAQYPANIAYANSGFGDSVDINNQPVKVPTYYANSPIGPVNALDANGLVTLDPVTGLPKRAQTGKALRKFVDTLPGIGAAKKNNLGQYIPLAVAEKWVDLSGNPTNDDYLEIAAVEYTEKMHSDLPKATLLRGYVQLSTLKNPGKKIALTYPIPAGSPAGTLAQPILDAAGVQVYAYDTPHHLGPIINATSGVAVRVKFSNYLPKGLGGELFIPTDSTITGAGTGPDGVTPYTQNRAVMHLVGGGLPWISAGNPHQWIAPAGEVNPDAATGAPVADARGVSAQNVPDMADPGPGAATLYFPNDQSARFMFYHDRASGLTRLNAYAGMEAGYLITDAAEQKLITDKVIPGAADTIPLIIEDKTFVPGNIAQQDAKWNVDVAGLPVTTWGKPGDLWFPHVYEPNQDPTSAMGTNAVGRWDFGPLFWPIFPTDAPLPSGAHGDVTFVPEAYLDTPVINGTAYPTLTVDPKAYRFRILNASNDRYVNLGLYKADATPGIAPHLDPNGNPIYSAAGAQLFFVGTEVKLVPALADAAGNPANWDPVNQVQLPLPQYPNLLQNNNVASSGPARAWPTDARRGGVPDPLAAGPDIIAIGNDGGFLPNAVDIPSQPMTYEANRRSITVNNAYGYGLLLGPAERSDAIIDFSAYAGQTLIVYNDAPAPFPFSDERNDYYSGNPDMTGVGGAYATRPGYGPNTRTMMQIKVKAAPVALTGKFNADALLTALPAAYAASQPAPLVPAIAYNNAFKTNDPDIYAHIATGAASQPTLDFSTAVANVVTLTEFRLVTSGGTINAAGNVVPNTGSGTGYDPLNPPTVRVNNDVNGIACLTGNDSASATAVVDPITRQVSAITNFYAGSGYNCAPTVSFDSAVGVGAQVSVISSATNFHSLPVTTIAEQELFDNRGRYNKTGGVELPFTNAINQTTIPLNYIDAATESIKDGEVQVWKITVNGLFSNSLSFNLADVQLINRVGWDGTVKPPSSNEVGWKNTLRMNPLEDVLLAVRAKRAKVPFGLPSSTRLRDPSKALNAAGSGMGFTFDAAVKGTNITRTNVVEAFDNEFVWNSAMLSNSENDFMRPIVFHPTVIQPSAPSNLADLMGNGTLTWTDPTPAGAATTPANPQNEIGFKVIENGNPIPVALIPANVTSWSNPVLFNAASDYTVVAYNAAGNSVPSVGYTMSIPVAPASVVADPLLFNSVTLTWTGASTNNHFDILRDGLVIATLPGSATSYVDKTVTAVKTYAYQINVVNGKGTASTSLSVTTPMEVIAAPTALTATPNAAGTAVTVRWTDSANNESAYWVEVVTNGAAAAPIKINRTAAQRAAVGGVMTLAPNFVTTPGNVYVFNVTAVDTVGAANLSVSPVASATVDLSKPVAPTAPTGMTATLASATRVNLAWLDNASTENSYLVTITNNTTGVVTTATVNRTAALSLATGGTVTYPAAVVAGNSYSFSVVAQATKFGQTTASTAITAGPVLVAAPAQPTALAAVSNGIGSKSITLNWTDAPVNATSYTVQRATSNAAGVLGAFGNAGTVLPGVQTFVDINRIVGRTYQYQVRANGVMGTLGFVQSGTVVAQ